MRPAIDLRLQISIDKGSDGVGISQDFSRVT